MVCRVKGCRHAHTHLTSAHRCRTCGDYGHGQIECGVLSKIADLQRRSMHDTLAYQCTVSGCGAPSTHMNVAHHCYFRHVRQLADLHNCQRCKHRSECICKTISRTCPQCNLESGVDLATLLFTTSECIICYESGPSVIFSGCRHTNVCKTCALRLV